MFSVRISLTNFATMVQFTRRLDFPSEAECTDEAFREGVWGLLMQVCHAEHGVDFAIALQMADLSCGDVMEFVESWGYHYTEIDL
jgi:hypothetical protein